MNRLRSIVLSTAAALAIAAVSVAPSLAYEPLPTNSIHININPRAEAQGGVPGIAIGTLKTSRYWSIKTNVLTGTPVTTLVFSNGAGVKRTVSAVADQSEILVDFGPNYNSGYDAFRPDTVTIAANTHATALNMDISVVSAVVTK